MLLEALKRGSDTTINETVSQRIEAERQRHLQDEGKEVDEKVLRKQCI